MTPAATVHGDAALMALATNAAKGDASATSALLRVVSPRLLRVVRAVLGGAHPDLEDAAQQGVIAFVQALPAFRGECDPMGYASAIAVRTAIRAQRRRRTDLARRDDGAESEAIEASDPSPSDVASAERRKALLRDLLAELPAPQAEALAMRVVLGWSLDEIAARTEAPANTVRSRIRLAKEALKRRIEADPALCEELEGAR